MQLWKLTPLDLSAPNWEASTYIGPAIVRAPDEVEARTAANKKFSRWANKQPIGDPVRHPPWDLALLVTAVTIDDERFEVEGPTEVLDPDC